jgi:hypothetical protein
MNLFREFPTPFTQTAVQRKILLGQNFLVIHTGTDARLSRTAHTGALQVFHAQRPISATGLANQLPLNANHTMATDKPVQILLRLLRVGAARSLDRRPGSLGFLQGAFNDGHASPHDVAQRGAYVVLQQDVEQEYGEPPRGRRGRGLWWIVALLVLLALVMQWLR